MFLKYCLIFYYWNATTVWFVLRFALRNFSVHSRVGAVTEEQTPNQAQQSL